MTKINFKLNMSPQTQLTNEATAIQPKTNERDLSNLFPILNILPSSSPSSCSKKRQLRCSNIFERSLAGTKSRISHEMCQKQEITYASNIRYYNSAQQPSNTYSKCGRNRWFECFQLLKYAIYENKGQKL